MKLLDFGLARVEARATITRQCMILGTPDYMSPEQAMGHLVDQRSDIFSTGAVFYEFLAGQKPFKGKTLPSVLYQIIFEEPDSLLTLVPELPARLAAIVHRLLRKKPEHRYQSLEDVWRDLHPVYEALRRSRGLSALPMAHPVSDEARARARELLGRARQALEGDRAAEARSLCQECRVIDPALDEACDVCCRASRRLPQLAQPMTIDSVAEPRIQALLQKAPPASPRRPPGSPWASWP